MRYSTILVVLVASAVGHAFAQDTALPTAGQRVRVTASNLGHSRLEAQFTALDNATLVVTADSTVRIPLADVTRLEIWRGRRSHPVLGAALGFMTGALAGLAVAGAFPEGEDQEEMAIYPAIGAAAGLLLGTGIGFAVRTDRWVAVPLDRVGSHARAGGRTLNVGIAIRI
jgi:hypothetical protein